MESLVPNVNPLVLIFAAVFTSNVLLSNFLGMCSFIAISRDQKSSMGLGLAVTVVLVVTGALNWAILEWVLKPFGIVWLRYIVFIMVIAASVQMLEMLLDRLSPTLHMALGIFLPLITVNCAILGVALFIEIRNYSFLQAIAYSFGAGVGWWLAILILAAIQKKLERAKNIPKGLQGPGMTLMIIGFMALAFSGFTNMVPVN